MFNIRIVEENPHGPTRYGWGRILLGESIITEGHNLTVRGCKAIAAATAFCRRRPEFDFTAQQLADGQVQFTRVPAGTGNIHQHDPKGAEESSERRLYNFHKMVPGDNFLAPGDSCDKKDCKAVRAAYAYRTRHPGFEFTARDYSPGMVLITCKAVPPDTALPNFI